MQTFLNVIKLKKQQQTATTFLSLYFIFFKKRKNSGTFAGIPIEYFIFLEYNFYRWGRFRPGRTNLILCRLRRRLLRSIAVFFYFQAEIVLFS
jgi:hypothetical protein